MKYLMLSVLSLVLFSCSNQTDNNNEYLSANVSLYKPTPEDISNLMSKQLISKQKALETFDMLQKSFQASYIGYNAKKFLIGKSGDEIFAECKKDIENIETDLTSFSLYDHVLKCLALIKDTHINMKASIPANYVTTIVNDTKLVDEKLIVTGIYPNLMKKLEEIGKLKEGEISEKINLGYEIIEINGQPALQALNDFKKYISASSAAAENNEACEFIFYRNFNYPKEKTVSLKLKDLDGKIIDLIVPWVQTRGGTIESRSHLNVQGIVKTVDISDAKDLMKVKSFDVSKPVLQNMSNVHEYYDEDDGNVVLSTGVAQLKEKNYCYLQLQTFGFEYDDTLKEKIFEQVNGKFFAVSLMTVLKNFLSNCETFKAPLVLDLRDNNGGNPELAHNIFSMLEKENSPIAYQARARYVQVGNKSVLTNVISEVDTKEPSLFALLNFQAVKNAVDQNQEITSWMLTKDLKAARNVFTGQVYTLTSPKCISACDGFVNRIKLTKRGLIAGTHTNGTGFGFSSAGNNSSTKFRDQNNLFEIAIPNHSFQTAVAADDSEFYIVKDSKGSLLAFDKLSIMENRPTMPDVEIKYTLRDLSDKYVDYLTSLAAAIETDQQTSGLK